MAQFTITAIDTTGIQPYIFGSNRLRENIGASELVRLTTGEWALKVIQKITENYCNIKDITTGELDESFQIETTTQNSAAEVIYAGGGNIVVIFRSKDIAKKFVGQLTYKVLNDAPGLSLVAAHDDLEWDAEKESGDRPLAQVVQDLLGVKLAAHKVSRLIPQPLLGLGVTADCESTRLVAVQTNEGEYRGVSLSPEREEIRLISRETRAKLVASNRANRRLAELFKEELSDWFEFPFNIDELGRVKGEESYFAIVHADGNGIGKYIKEIANKFLFPKDNRHINEIRRFSKNLHIATQKALHYIVRSLTKSELYKDSHRLPFRPLVFGGDDISFICNGKIGLSLAATFLKAFEAETERYLSQKFYACAGIAIVKMHYPFARAYQLSEALLKEAKKFIKKEPYEKASALDWHFATGGLSGSLSEIRDREYKVSQGNLLMRPLLLHPEVNDQHGHAWYDRIEKLIRIFQSDPHWSQKRNKIKSLREALREGSTAVEHFRHIYELKELPNLIPNLDTYQKNGWQQSKCGYFDAIELIDLYQYLED